MKKDEEEDTTDEEEDIDEEGLEDLDLEEGEEGMGSRTIQVGNPRFSWSLLFSLGLSSSLLLSLINRPGVAGAVLQTPSLSHSVSLFLPIFKI